MIETFATAASPGRAPALTPPPDATLRERLAQLLFVRIGSNLPPVRTAEEDEERVAQLLDEAPVGGLILFNGTYAKTPATLDRLQQRSRYPLLVTADMERGAGQQLRGYPLFPHAMAFDALGAGAAETVRRFGELTGQTARAAGVHVDFAPVADVNSNPRNPIISTRAFGTEPHRVAELAAAFVRGGTAAGLLTAAKHFPGHGDTHEDSHHALPTVEAARELLNSRDLPPFRAVIDAGLPIVMTAHVRYPSLDATGRSATLSRSIITDLLRGELGFRGAVVTDSMLMEGVKVGSSHEGESALGALNAGVDILLDVAEPKSTLEFLEQAVAAGRLSEARVNDALAQVHDLKNKAFGASDALQVDERRNREQTEQLALDVARRATVILREDKSLLPLQADAPLCAILVNPYPQPSNAEPAPLGNYLRSRFARVDYFEVGAAPTREELERATAAAHHSPQLLAAFVVKPAAWHHFGLPPVVRQWLEQLAAARPMVAACLGAPQGLEPLSAAAVQICTFSDVPASQAALADALLSNR
jgi:beta-glucosidase-like glycosyl hydrolase